jgi:hypothetical protein
MEEEKNEVELKKKLLQHYLDSEQAEYLIRDFAQRVKGYYQYHHNSEMFFDEHFISMLSIYWAAEDLMRTETYRYYLCQMLIKQDFAYLLRDYFMIELYKR